MLRSFEHIDQNLFGQHRYDHLRPYQVDAADDGSVTYTRYHPGDADGKNIIMRVTVTDGGAANTITTTEVAYGDWDNRDALTYQPINGDEDIRHLSKGIPGY